MKFYDVQDFRDSRIESYYYYYYYDFRGPLLEFYDFHDVRDSLFVF